MIESDIGSSWADGMKLVLSHEEHEVFDEHLDEFDDISDRQDDGIDHHPEHEEHREELTDDLRRDGSPDHAVDSDVPEEEIHHYDEFED